MNFSSMGPALMWACAFTAAFMMLSVSRVAEAAEGCATINDTLLKSLAYGSTLNVTDLKNSITGVNETSCPNPQYWLLRIQELDSTQLNSPGKFLVKGSCGGRDFIVSNEIQVDCGGFLLASFRCVQVSVRALFPPRTARLRVLPAAVSFLCRFPPTFRNSLLHQLVD